MSDLGWTETDTSRRHLSQSRPEVLLVAFHKYLMRPAPRPKNHASAFSWLNPAIIVSAWKIWPAASPPPSISFITRSKTNCNAPPQRGNPPNPPAEAQRGIAITLPGPPAQPAPTPNPALQAALIERLPQLDLIDQLKAGADLNQLG